MLTGPTPDITAGQIGALMVFIAGQGVAYGLISDHAAQLVVSIGSIVVAAVWKIADAYLRGSRAKAALSPASPTPPAPPTVSV